MGEAVHSLYVRGSVANGQAIPNVSDIDSFAVMPADKIDGPAFEAWAEVTSAELAPRFPHVAGVELEAWPLESATDRNDPAALIIKLESACVHGEDLAGQIEGFRPGVEVAIGTRYFRHFLDAFLEEYPLDGEEERRGTIAWISRRFLRVGMELVMEQEQRFTRDLYLCYESFARGYPEQAEAMYHALELAVNPVADREAEGLVRDFGEWLAEAASAFLADRT